MPRQQNLRIQNYPHLYHQAKVRALKFPPCCFCLFFGCSAMSPRGFPRIFGYDLQAMKYSISVPLDRGGFVDGRGSNADR